jgi:hypothetical protein
MGGFVPPICRLVVEVRHPAALARHAGRALQVI